jgi:DNA modification methylase
MFKKGLILFLLLNSTLARPAAVTKKIEGLYDWKPKNTTITAQNALDINKKIEELKVKIHFTDPDDEISKKLKAELAIQENILKNITITFTGPKITPENLITQKPAKKDYLTEQEFYDFLMTKKTHL